MAKAVVSSWQAGADDTICLWLTSPQLKQEIFSLTNPLHRERIKNMLIEAGFTDDSAPLRSLLDSLVGATINMPDVEVKVDVIDISE